MTTTGPVGKEGANLNGGVPETVRAEMEVAIAAEIRRQLQLERGIIKDALSVAFRIVAAAVVVLLAVFTVFGITTWSNIEGKTEQYMRGRVDSLVQSDGSQHSVAGRLNILLNRSIVDSTLIRLKKESTNGDFALSNDDWDRMRRWVENKNTNIEDFEAALAVLNLQSPSRKDKDALGIFAKMLDPSRASKFGWIDNQPDKRLAILLGFKNDNLGRSVTHVAADKDLLETIRAAAVRYLVTIGYRDSFTTLLSIANMYDGKKFGVEAAAAAIVLQPAQKQSFEIIKSMLSTKPHRRLMDVGFMLSQIGVMRSELMPDGAYGASDYEVKLLRKYEAELLEFLFGNGAFLEKSYSLVDMHNQEYLELLVGVSAIDQAIGGYGGYRFRLPPQELARVSGYWNALDKDAAHDNLTDLRRQMIRRDPRPEPIVFRSETYDRLTAGSHRFDVRVEFSSGSGAVVRLDHGGGTFKLQSDAEILLGRAGREIDANWKVNGRNKMGKVISFYGSDIHFYLEVDGVEVN